MTPVEATRTASALQPSASAARVAVRRAFRSPCAPVAALALPALITMARIASEGTRARSQRTGAAQTRLVVNIPAAAHGPSAASTARSSPPDGLIPALTAAARKPAGIERGTCSFIEVRSRLLRRVSPVDEQGRPGHEARRLGGEEDGGRPEFRRIAPAPE